MDELYALDDTVNLKTCYGVIFLFKWKAELQAPPQGALQEFYPPSLFFASQVIPNRQDLTSKCISQAHSNRQRSNVMHVHTLDTRIASAI